MKYILPVPTLLNKMYRAGAHGVYLSQSAKEFKDFCHATLKKEPIEGNVSVTIIFYRQRKSGDVDAPIKLLLDAMQRIAYVNDNQVTELHVYRKDDKDNPRIELTVEPAEY